MDDNFIHQNDYLVKIGDKNHTAFGSNKRKFLLPFFVLITKIQDQYCILRSTNIYIYIYIPYIVFFIYDLKN